MNLTSILDSVSNLILTVNWIQVSHPLTHTSHTHLTHTPHTERALLYGLPDLLTRAAEAELESFPPECGISHCSIVYVAQVTAANIGNPYYIKLA